MSSLRGLLEFVRDHEIHTWIATVVSVLVAVGGASMISIGAAFAAGILVGGIAVAGVVLARYQTESVAWQSYDAVYRLTGKKGEKTKVVEETVVRARSDVETMMYATESIDGNRTDRNIKCQFDDKDSWETPEVKSVRLAGISRVEVWLVLPRTLKRRSPLKIIEKSDYEKSFEEDDPCIGKKVLGSMKRVQFTLIFDQCKVQSLRAFRNPRGSQHRQKTEWLTPGTIEQWTIVQWRRKNAAVGDGFGIMWSWPK